MENFDVVRILKFLPGVIAGLSVHEFMHAFAAKKLGDETAYEQGRVTLNPLKHIDLLGFLFIVLAGFGWAKPVQINEAKLKKPRRDNAIISLAGPFSNMLLAMLLSLIFILIAWFMRAHSPAEFPYMRTVSECLIYAVYVNWGLFVFNMIPIPPLDGSHLIFHSLRKKEKLYANIYRYGTIALFVILIVQSRTDVEILHIFPLVQFFASAFFDFAKGIFF